jgi:hypothetical protein
MYLPCAANQASVRGVLALRRSPGFRGMTGDSTFASCGSAGGATSDHAGSAAERSEAVFASSAAAADGSVAGSSAGSARSLATVASSGAIVASHGPAGLATTSAELVMAESRGWTASGGGQGVVGAAAIGSGAKGSSAG